MSASRYRRFGRVVLALRLEHERHVVEPDGDVRVGVAEQDPLHLERLPVELLGFLVAGPLTEHPPKVVQRIREGGMRPVVQLALQSRPPRA